MNGHAWTASGPLRIGVSGSFGGLNLGDEAILSVALRRLRRARPAAEIVIFSRNAARTRELHPAGHAVAIRELDEAAAGTEIERLDALVLCGGGILFDIEATIFLREVLLAQRMGIPTLALAIGAGPLAHYEERSLVARAVNGMTSVSVRSRWSRELLLECGVTRDVRIVADPAWILPLEAPAVAMPLARIGLPADRPLVAVAVREAGPAAPRLWSVDYHGCVAAAAAHLIDRYGAHIMFVPMEACDDEHARRVAAEIGREGSVTVLERPADSVDVFQLMRHARLAFGLRYHALLFAASAGVPVVALPFVEKVRELAADLALFDDRRPDTTPSSLRLALDAAWHESDHQRAVTAAAVRARRKAAHAGLEQLMTSLPRVSSGRRLDPDARVASAEVSIT